MKAVDLREKSTEELVDLLKETGGEIKNTVSGILEGKQKNTASVGVLRRDVARIKTVLNERKILEEVQNE